MTVLPGKTDREVAKGLLTNPAVWNLLSWVRRMGYGGPLNRFDRRRVNDHGITTIIPPLPNEAVLTVYPLREGCPGYPVKDGGDGSVALRLTNGRGWIGEDELRKLLK